MQKYEHIFNTDNLKNDLKKKSLRSGAITITSQAVMFIIQLGSTIILARILSPADYGINAMAVAITGFAGMFSNLGLSAATVQRPDITHEQVSALFWINTAIGLLVTLIIVAISPVVASFYKTPEMLWVMISLSITFTISGLSVQHSALLNRQMRFFSIAQIDVTAMLAGIIVAIIIGYYGYGYWALIFNTITQTSVRTLGCWFCCRWIPGKPVRNVGVSSMIRFGADLLGFNIINYFARNLDNVLIGRYHGTNAVGLYSKAYQLLMMPITNLKDPITRVAMPALSRLQNNPEDYRNYYLGMVSLLAFVSMPMVALFYTFSHQIVIFLLGSQWGGASELFKILAIAAFIQPVSTTSGMILITTGRSRLYLKLGILGAVITCASFAAGLPWGAKGVAIAYVAANYLLLFPVFLYTFKGTSITIKNFINAVYRPLISSLFMIVISSFLLKRLPDEALVTVLFGGGTVSFCIYLLVFISVFNGYKDLKQYYSYGQLIFKK